MRSLHFSLYVLATVLFSLGGGPSAWGQEAVGPQFQQMIQSGQVTPAQVQEGLKAVEGGQISPAQVQELTAKTQQGTLTPAEIEAGRKMLAEQQQAKEEKQPAAEKGDQQAAEEENSAEEGGMPDRGTARSEKSAFFQRIFGADLPDLTIYGHPLFSRSPALVNPITAVPVSNDYIIGVGDVIKVLMWGRLDASYELEVDSEGVINFPKIGPLNVVGLTYKDLKELITRKTEAITGVNVSVSMGRLRTMQVFVLGEIRRPGIYTISSIATALNGLLTAGAPNIPLPASLRNVQVKREGKIIARLDIYELLMRGDISNDIRLMPGDIIFVPRAATFVAVTGDVKSPHVFELKENERTLREALRLASGLAPRAYNQRIQISRAVHNQAAIILDIPYADLPQHEQVPLQDGDIVNVFSIMPAPANAVFLFGNVLRPGQYAFQKGLRLRDIVPNLESLAVDTYFDYGLVKRYHLQDMSTELIPFDLGAMLADTTDAHNLTLMPLDEIYVFNKWKFEDKPTASISGEVRKPGTYTADTMKVKDLIQQAGNLTDAASLHKGELIRTDPDQTRHTLYFNVARAMADDPLHNLAIAKSDKVVIHSIWEERWQESVAIEGEIKKPGEFSLTDRMRIKDLIFKAGNFTRNASMESAHLYRTDWRTKEVTIHTFNVTKALAEDPEQNLLLEDMDRVVIHSAWEYVEQYTVSAQGMVGKPGKYPYASNMTVKDLLLVAGNVRESAFLDQAEIIRSDIKDGKQVQTSLLTFDVRRAFADDPANNIKLQPWDIVYIKQIPEWGERETITLSGEVLFPGTYSIRKSERLSSLIERAGGFTDQAYFRGAVFTRESVRVQQQKHLDELIARLSKEMTQVATSELAGAISEEQVEGQKQISAAQQAMINRLKEVKAAGRVVIRLAPGPEFAGSNYNLALEGGDRLYVPPRPDTVSVAGEVYNPTNLVFDRKKPTAKQYLALTGGPTDYANEKEMYILRADGTVYSRSSSGSSNVWLSSFEDTPLYPGDTLVVPPKLIFTRFKTELKDITSIVYEIAVSAGIIINQVFR